MITKTLPIGKLFSILEKYEKLNFLPDQEQYINSTLQIQDEHSNWIDINAAIIKNDTGRQITFDNGDVIKAADKHLIYNGKECVYIKNLKIGDALVKASGEKIVINEITPIEDNVFYDLNVNSDTHLYQTTNGIIHHNTMLAKSLAKHLGVKLIRIDLSEYQEKHSISKLIGSPPGYVGFEDNAGILITQIQENPNAVLLFDEMEKAHPDVLTVLLQIMDNGFVTGSNGKQADCRNIILILTTNAGAKTSEKNTIGFHSLENMYEDTELKEFLAPEFRNRLDGVIKFNKLSRDVMILIIKKFLNELREQVKSKNIKIKDSSAAIEWLLEKGFDSKMGARPLARIIDKEIKRDLAKMILYGELKKGGTLIIDVEDDKLKLIAKEKILKLPPVTVGAE